MVSATLLLRWLGANGVQLCDSDCPSPFAPPLGMRLKPNPYACLSGGSLYNSPISAHARELYGKVQTKGKAQINSSDLWEFFKSAHFLPTDWQLQTRMQSKLWVTRRVHVIPQKQASVGHSSL